MDVCTRKVCARDMYAGGKIRCVSVCANADGLVPVTLVSLIFSRWDTVSGCNTWAHAHTYG